MHATFLRNSDLLNLLTIYLTNNLFYILIKKNYFYICIDNKNIQTGDNYIYLKFYIHTGWFIYTRSARHIQQQQQNIWRHLT